MNENLRPIYYTVQSEVEMMWRHLKSESIEAATEVCGAVPAACGKKGGAWCYENFIKLADKNKV